MTVSKRLIIAFILGIALTIGADLLLKSSGNSEAKLWGSGLIGYWAAFGFVWYLLIVGFSKLLGRFWLERREEYYAEEDEVGDG